MSIFNVGNNNASQSFLDWLEGYLDALPETLEKKHIEKIKEKIKQTKQPPVTINPRASQETFPYIPYNPWGVQPINPFKPQWPDQPQFPDLTPKIWC